MVMESVRARECRHRLQSNPYVVTEEVDKRLAFQLAEAGSAGSKDYSATARGRWPEPQIASARKLTQITITRFP